MKIQELGHVVLYVRDLEASLGSCRDILGLVDLRGERARTQ